MMTTVLYLIHPNRAKVPATPKDAARPSKKPALHKSASLLSGWLGLASFRPSNILTTAQRR